MNKGTALKWIDAVENGNFEHGAGGLRLDENCFCIFGVLLNFLDPAAWKRNALGIYEWNGLSIYLTPGHPTTLDVMKRCKMKSHDGTFVTANGDKLSLVEVNDSETGWAQPIYNLKKYYEQL